MKAETENAIRSIVSIDDTVDKSVIERAIHLLRGCPEREEDMMHIVRRKEALKILKVHRRTLDYYISQGYLQRVFGGGRKRALGISRDSLMAFMRTGLEAPRCALPVDVKKKK